MCERIEVEKKEVGVSINDDSELQGLVDVHLLP